MDLRKYTELTGETVAPANEAKVKATIRRTKAQLEALLGFTLKPKNLYTERGKVTFEGNLPLVDDLSNLDSLVLLDPDEEVGTYKLFPFNEADKYFHVDPFKNVYRVKLVMPLPNGEFVTVTELNNVVPSYGRDNIGKFIERHYEWFTWSWYRTWRYGWQGNSGNGLMLAIDADWLDCYPDDVMYLWGDMVTHYADPDYNIRSESVDGHSWSKGAIVAPENNPMNKALLTRYAGPYGSIARNPVR